MFIIDYGLAKPYLNLKTKQHIPYRENKKLTGTAKFASINTHIGIEQSRRDDLEGLSYILVYFMNGELPWHNLPAKDKEEKYKKIMEKKIETKIEDLCLGASPEFGQFMYYCRNLKFEEEPNYVSLWKKFEDCFFGNGYHKGFDYDWNLMDLNLLECCKKLNVIPSSPNEGKKEEKKQGSSSTNKEEEPYTIEKEKVISHLCRKVQSKISTPIPKIRLSDVLLWKNEKEEVKEDNQETMRIVLEQSTLLAPLKTAEVTSKISQFKKREMWVEEIMESCNFATDALFEHCPTMKHEENSGEEIIPLENLKKIEIKIPESKCSSPFSHSWGLRPSGGTVVSERAKNAKKINQGDFISLGTIHSNINAKV